MPPKPAHNKPVQVRALYPMGPQVSLRSHSLTPLNHIAPRLCSAQRLRQATVTRNWARASRYEKMDIWVGSVVRIQRVWRKSLPVIRRKEELLRFLARKISCTSRKIVVGTRFRWIWNQGFAPNPYCNIVSSPGLQSLLLVISHLAQLRVTHSPRSGHEILLALGFRSARIRSLRSTTLRLAYARRNVAGFSR
jgi:hypothetical protein